VHGCCASCVCVCVTPFVLTPRAGASSPTTTSFVARRQSVLAETNRRASLIAVRPQPHPCFLFTPPPHGHVWVSCVCFTDASRSERSCAVCLAWPGLASVRGVLCSHTVVSRQLRTTHRRNIGKSQSAAPLISLIWILSRQGVAGVMGAAGGGSEADMMVSDSVAVHAAAPLLNYGAAAQLLSYDPSDLSCTRTRLIAELSS
jgi:hypothetical protein